MLPEEVISGIFFSKPSYGGLWLLNSSIKELYYISGSRGFGACVVSVCCGEEKKWKRIQIEESSLLFENKRKKKSFKFSIHFSFLVSLAPSAIQCLVLPSYADIKCFPSPKPPFCFRITSLLCVWIKKAFVAVNEKKFHPPHPTMAM